MKDEDFVIACRNAQKHGQPELRATLACRYRGVLHIVIRNLQGYINGNPHDLWIQSVSGKTTLGRARLKSRRVAEDLEGWPARIANIHP